jgi:hypothetical protein
MRDDTTIRRLWRMTQELRASQGQNPAAALADRIPVKSQGRVIAVCRT